MCGCKNFNCRNQVYLDWIIIFTMLYLRCLCRTRWRILVCVIGYTPNSDRKKIIQISRIQLSETNNFFEFDWFLLSFISSLYKKVFKWFKYNLFCKIQWCTQLFRTALFLHWNLLFLTIPTKHFYWINFLLTLSHKLQSK